MRIAKNEAGVYEVRFKGPDGKWKSRTTRQKNRRDAEAAVKASKLAEIELAAELGILTKDVVSVMLTGRRINVEDAIEPWSQWMKRQRHSDKSISDAVTWVKAWANSRNLMHFPLIGVKESDVDGWINEIGKASKAGTRKQMLVALRSFFGFCSASGWIMGNPAALVNVDMDLLLHAQKETDQKEPFTDEEVRALLVLTSPQGEKPSTFWNPAIAIGRWTGLRLGDICGLEWDCFAKPGKIIVWTQKRDKRVELPLEPFELADAVEGLERNDPQFVFPRHRQIILDPQRRSILSSRFAALLAKAGIVGKSFHCLRASYITACDAAGIPIEHIGRSVGHSNWWTTRGYIRHANAK